MTCPTQFSSFLENPLENGKVKNGLTPEESRRSSNLSYHKKIHCLVYSHQLVQITS